MTTMVSVDGTTLSEKTMRISSFEIGTVVKVERIPNDCTTSNGDNGKCRLFRVKNGGELYLSWVHLTGGHVGLTAQTIVSSKNDYEHFCGGLIYVHGLSSKLHAISSTFGTGSIVDLPTQKTAWTGGAIYARGGPITASRGPVVVLEDSEVIGNWADIEGGGLSVYNTKSSLIRTSVRGNKITTASASYGGGGIAVNYNSLLIAVDSVISDNSAHAMGRGAGVKMRYGCDPTDVDGCNRVVLANTVRLIC